MPSLILLKTPIQPPPFSEVQLTEEPQVIGQDARRSQIVIPSEYVSRTHCRVACLDGNFVLEDLGSRNGTYLHRARERARIKLEPHKPVPLLPDDQIEICDFVMQFRQDEDPPVELLATEELLAAPTDRLRQLLTLSADPARAAEVDPLLRQVADALFNTNLTNPFDLGLLLQDVAGTLLTVFGRSSRCLVLMADRRTRQLLPRVARGNRAGPTDRWYNRSLAHATVETRQARLVTERRATGPRSLMCCPLLASAEGGVAGVLLLEADDPGRPFDADDLHLFAILGNLASVAVDRVLIHEQARSRAVTLNQIEVARRVLEGFLPQRLPEIPGYEFFSHYSPAQTVGGDYYDFIPLPDGRLAVVLGDVAGKGVPAALLVAKLSSEVRYSLLSHPSPAAAMSLLNDQMIRGGLAEKFVTLVFVVLDPTRHQITVVNAGHHSPRLYSATCRTLETIIPVAVSGLPIGIRPGYRYESVTTDLQACDTVIAFTDGVIDAMDQAGRPFGLQAADLCLTPRPDHGSDAGRPRRMSEVLLDAVRRHCGGRHPEDDIAIVCFGRWEPDYDPATVMT